MFHKNRLYDYQPEPKKYELNGRLYSQRELLKYFDVPKKDLTFYRSYSWKELWDLRPLNRQMRRA